MSNKPMAWRCVASRFIKAEMQKRGLDYRWLSQALAELGTKQSEGVLRTKFSKGNFSAALLLQCIYVMRADINPLELGVIFEGCNNNPPVDTKSTDGDQEDQATE